MARKGKTSYQYDLWKPENIQKRDVLKLIDALEGSLRTLRNNVVHEDIDVHETYGKLFSGVESLYSMLDIGSLTQDHQRRVREHLEKVRRFHAEEQ